jgi:excisionase family DNA binding protein
MVEFAPRGDRDVTTDDGFLTTEEVLEYLQVNLRTVYRLIQAGKIPAVRVGRQWRFRKRDIDAWLESQRARGTRPAPAPSANRLRVLVVDDEESIRELLVKALEDYDVDTAPDAATALDHIRERGHYDLLISDLNMPGMDGLSLIKEVRQLKSSVPVIIVTGYSSHESAIDAANLGVSAYLTKPFQLPQVLAAAAKALGAPVV